VSFWRLRLDRVEATRRFRKSRGKEDGRNNSVPSSRCLPPSIGNAPQRGGWADDGFVMANNSGKAHSCAMKVTNDIRKSDAELSVGQAIASRAASKKRRTSSW